MRNEMQALRSNEPDPAAIDQTVEKVLAFAPAPARARANYVWKAVPLAACLGAGAFFLFGASQSASAASLRRVAEALRHQSIRHAKTYRPGPAGELVQTNEDWIDGKRHTELFIDENGSKTLSGYDGQRMFVYSTKDGGFVDDVEPSGPPVEDIDSYLNIPGAQVTKLVVGREHDVYTITCSNVAFDLYVNPATGLPIRREVLTRRGDLIEKNDYDYPTQIPTSTFKAPAVPGLTDYPALRQELSRRLTRPGQTKEVGGVKISLKAVLYGKSRLLAVWTGGARGGEGGGTWVEELPKPIALGGPEAFAANGPSVRGEKVSSDGAWYQNLSLDGPFTLNVPVWAEDRSAPIRGGFRSKIVGRLKFRVTDAIQAADPDRVLVRPSGEAVALSATSGKVP